MQERKFPPEDSGQAKPQGCETAGCKSAFFTIPHEYVRLKAFQHALAILALSMPSAHLPYF